MVKKRLSDSVYALYEKLWVHFWWQWEHNYNRCSYSGICHSVCQCYPVSPALNNINPALSPSWAFSISLPFLLLTFDPSCLRPSWSVGHQCPCSHTTQFPLEQFPPSSCERPFPVAKGLKESQSQRGVQEGSCMYRLLALFYPWIERQGVGCWCIWCRD